MWLFYIVKVCAICVEVDDDGRVVAIKIDNGVNCKLLCVGVYLLPCDDHSGEYRDSRQQIYGFIRPPDIVCRRTYILPVFLLSSSFIFYFSPPNIRGR